MTLLQDLISHSHNMNFIGYDIETEGDEEYYALQPWRVYENTARITLSSAFDVASGKRIVLNQDHNSLVSQFRGSDKTVVTFNGIFDVAFLYASGIDPRGINWMDGMILCKWLLNGQLMPHSMSLKNMSKRFLDRWPKIQEFLDMKSDELPDPSDPYWINRVSMDAEATALIAEYVWDLLTPQQKNLAIIQSRSMVPVAASWVNGVCVDLDAIEDSRPLIIQEMLAQEKLLGLVEPSPTGEYIPSKILRSPTKMRKLLYEDYGLVCTRFTEKGEKSTDKAALTYLADIDERCIIILKWRELNTILSKFVDGPIKACRYLNSTITHAAPRIFSTYTGRMTYSSKTKKAKTGIPLHQTPRKKEVRKSIIAPPGYYIFEADASGQEMRGMAVMSGDDRMRTLFNAKHPFDDGHSLMGSTIGGISFEEFLERKAADDEVVTGSHGLRAAGKFTNLSSAYRASPPTLRRQARVQYGLNIDIPTAAHWKKAYTDTFPAVKAYWRSAPKLAKAMGYAETPAGRRYQIARWKDLEWGSSSSAINFPIQGMGADQRDLAIATIIERHPELWNRFYFDLHDGCYFLLEKTRKVSYTQELIRTLDTIDYASAWGVNLDIPFVWEGSFGPNWGSKVDVPNCCGNMTLEEYYTFKLEGKDAA